MSDDKLDCISKDINYIKTDIAVVRTDLNYHITRTNLLEDSVEILKKDSNLARGAIYFVGFLGTLATITDVLVKLFHH